MFFTMPAHAVDAIFDEEQWISRVLVITGSKGDPLYLDQYDMLEGARDGFEARDTVIVHYKDRLIKRIDTLSVLPFRFDNILRETDEQRYMQERLRTDDDVFSVVLVGLDGTVKQVWTLPVSAQEIFDVIDAMPMRQREIRDADN